MVQALGALPYIVVLNRDVCCMNHPKPLFILDPQIRAGAGGAAVHRGAGSCHKVGGGVGARLSVHRRLGDRLPGHPGGPGRVAVRRLQGGELRFGFWL